MTEKFVITGMTCAACAAHVERAAASVPGVHSASVNLMLGSLVCDRDENVDPAASRPISIRLYTSPADAPSATSESILGAPLNSRENPTVK